MREELAALCTCNLTYPRGQGLGERAWSIIESVEVLNPVVERSTFVQKIEDSLKRTNISGLLATVEEQAESQEAINLCGIEF